MLNFFTKKGQGNPYQSVLPSSKGMVVEGTPTAPVYTVLDIGTKFVKAVLFEAHNDSGIVLGIGYHRQNPEHMSHGIIRDIGGVIASCNEAVVQAEQTAGGIIAPIVIIGISGELVRARSIIVNKMRHRPDSPITPNELDSMLSTAQKNLYKIAKREIVTTSGQKDIDIRVTNTSVTVAHIDGQLIVNPLGFRGRHVRLTVFTSFAPLMQVGAIQSIAQGLDLTLGGIISHPYALAQFLGTAFRVGGIFIDIGEGTTNIALVRQAGIEETRSLPIGSSIFSEQLATFRNILPKEAERQKMLYSEGKMTETEKEDISTILAPVCQVWIDAVESTLEEIAHNEVLPPAIFLVGGGSRLPDIQQKLESYPWYERLPFPSPPTVSLVQPNTLPLITDPSHFLRGPQEVPVISLAFQTIRMQHRNDAFDLSLVRVIQALHL